MSTSNPISAQAASALLQSFGQAQVGAPAIPAMQVYSNMPSYQTAFLNVAQPAAPTDAIEIRYNGGLCRVLRVVIQIVAGASVLVPVRLIKRTGLDTGGTPTALTSVRMDRVNDPNPLTVINAYAAAPTLGSTTSGGTIAALNYLAQANTAQPATLTFDLTNNGTDAGQALLTGGDSLAVNLGGTAITTGLLTGWIDFIEIPVGGQ